MCKQYQRTISGVRLRRTIRSTKNHEWVGIIDDHGVRFIPTVGWRNGKPTSWLPCNRFGKCPLGPWGFHSLTLAIKKTKEAIANGKWEESCE